MHAKKSVIVEKAKAVSTQIWERKCSDPVGQLHVKGIDDARHPAQGA